MTTPNDSITGADMKSHSESDNRPTRLGFGLLDHITRTNKLVLCLTGMLFLAGNGPAAPITYTFSATGSGSLGGNLFSNSFFQITAAADTSQIYSTSPGIFRVTDSLATVVVPDVGTATFAITTMNVDNQNLSSVGFSDPGQNLAILFVENPVFVSYDLSTAMGPVSGPPIFNEGAQFLTSSGNFSLDEVSTATFEASVEVDTDADGDGVLDTADQCPGTPAGEVVNAVGCSISQLVPAAGPWKNHGQYVSQVTHVAGDFVAQGLITRAQKGAIVSAAARSNVGKRR
jgi:hypothetical protein